MISTCSDGPEGSEGGARGPASPLAARLLQPAGLVPLAALPQHWFRQRIALRVAGTGMGAAAALAADPALPGRLRGAWGRALMRGASPEALDDRPCPWTPPCALDPLFRAQGAITARLALPRPYVLAVRALDGDLWVELTVFGFACDWIDAAAEALVAALRHGEPPPLGHPVTLRDRQVITEETVAVPPPEAGPAILTFHTPVAFRDGGAVRRPTLRTLISGLGNRVSGLARWQDTAVQADWRGLAEYAETLPCDLSGLQLRRWERHSARQEGRAIPLSGWLGPVVIGGDLTPILPLLALATTCHAGSHTTHGLGACSLALAGA